MEIITIISRKGGTSKTTTAQALGAYLTKKRKRVLYIDLDSQANLTFALNASGDGVTSFEVLTAKTDIKDGIRATDRGDLLPGKEALATADNIITQTGKEYRLKEALNGLNYDYVIIDTPAQLGILTVNALTASTRCVIPVQADIYSVQGIGLLNDTIEAVKKYCNPALIISGILLTRYNGRAVLSQNLRDSFEDIAAQLHTKLFKTPIRECIAVKEAQAVRQDIFTYSPKCNASRDYEAFIKEFMQA